ncbi:hypothetical protein [Dactylosporangium sp. NPDC051484]|uniref:hypothetical protein n=1 Tax=Dactylosporangium sp. NPDC051484 TaxID=3154942 RepID=UPI00344F21FF
MSGLAGAEPAQPEWASGSSARPVNSAATYAGAALSAMRVGPVGAAELLRRLAADSDPDVARATATRLARLTRLA